MAKLSKAVLEHFRAWGAQGGNKSSANMSAAQRRARALKAVRVRERKRKIANGK